MPWVDDNSPRPTNIRCVDCKWLAASEFHVSCEAPCPWKGEKALDFTTPPTLFERHECDLYQPKEDSHE